ncbi:MULTISPECIES: universal stress protein [Brucella/Ochrobactrum group]|uniref:Universal stress protein n=1 Tax=Brucella anthropi (strain ATCC 49188 / DSM 6882 / CCUG 24695 / JCM 21032 / LMG 3331 / NBRC 15819 / NCTC 12168 / Alc 37) TaxID=439375 RepID=A6WXN3_BRUA4|nr:MULTISPECIES: universal stress protein [Brucella/Ochrobactrum group]ABS13737.1 UspA domain protein [Brucella anthropi ATCC 49188]AIK42930.1 universal stress family protein [Brucella anthropi]KAB2736782.1 universal stress protein [Brucella anthropi]KAB2750904.1 universal stress protein [Brucella anthropi]KAB2763283.1 universal stress protein [Brucella anthropi]
MYKNILIATDGSELAEKGVDQGVALAKETGAKVIFVSVTELLPSYGIVVAAEWASSPAAFQEYREAITKAATEILSKAKAKAMEIGVSAEAVHVENQSPAQGIVEAANAKNTDLIVIASHGRRGVNKLLLGSQAAEVLSLSTVPVLVIK